MASPEELQDTIGGIKERRDELPYNFALDAIGGLGLKEARARLAVVLPALAGHDQETEDVSAVIQRLSGQVDETVVNPLASLALESRSQDPESALVLGEQALERLDIARLRLLERRRRIEMLRKEVISLIALFDDDDEKKVGALEATQESRQSIGAIDGPLDDYSKAL